MTAQKIVSDDFTYEITIGMTREQLGTFYTTMAKAHKNWPGGESYEQFYLEFLRNESWKLLLEAQFKG